MADRESNDGSEPHPFLGRLVLGGASPEELLSNLVDDLHATPELDRELCGRIGAGNLESLLRHHEDELWPEVERLAREDERFRLALAMVWAYDSARAEDREALLAELGADRSWH